MSKEEKDAYYLRKMNEILDKINASGYESLSEEEKRLLKEASEHLAGKSREKN